MKKSLFVFIGESFRTGGQGTRVRGQECSVNEQINACQSHCRLLDKVEYEFGYKPEVVVCSYTTPYDHMILESYGERVILSEFLPNPIGYYEIFCHSVELYSSILDNYDFVFYIRIDAILKDYFINKFQIRDKVLYPSVCWRKDCGVHYPRVSDTMIYIPKKYFIILHNKLNILCHDSYCSLLHFVEFSQIGFFVNTYHDSDSQKDWNPMYKTANRPESTVWHSIGLMHSEEHWNQPVTPEIDFEYITN